MATLYILFLLLIFHSCFSGVSGIDFLTNASLSKLNSTELLTAMIREQIRICPYIALCTSPNTSVFPLRFSYSSLCCQECSCDYTCVQESSCCPDFNEEHFARTEIRAENTTQPVISDVNLTDSARTLCVKTHHGSFLSTDGFMMVASCPFKFKDKDVKRKCEMKFDYSSTFDIHDHTPVTDTIAGLTFKNRFCKLCNKGNNISVTFWNVWLKCKGSATFVFRNYPRNSLFEFARTALLDPAKLCSIVFDFENTMIGSNVTPTSCKMDNIIDTCDENNPNDVLQILCHKYLWPIKVRLNSNNRIYKNYACMLCNGVEFREWCPVFNYGKERAYAVLLTSSIDKTQQMPTLNSDDNTNNVVHHRGQVIERFFPNDAGEVHCRKGFVYDSKKDTCRLVLCPVFFFVTNGECVPMLGVVRGIVYQVILQADMHFVVQRESEEKVETAFAASLDELLLGHLGDGQYEFFIWKSNSKQWQLSEHHSYLIIVAISGNIEEGRYISVLKSINKIVLFKNQLNISTQNGKNTIPLNIPIRFNTSTKLMTDWTPFGQYNSRFHLIKSNTKTGNIKIKGTGTTSYISPMKLCYRVSLFDNEVQNIGNTYISISSTILYNTNFERVTHKGKQINIVCLHHALNYIPETVSYIFLTNNGTHYRFISRATSNYRTYPSDTSDIKTEDEKRMLFEKSSVATIFTIVFVTFVILIRILMKRLTAGRRKTSAAEGTVRGMELGNRKSDDEGSDIGAEVMNKAINEAEEPNKSVQITGNEEENMNESNGKMVTAINKEEITDESVKRSHVPGS